MEKEKVVYWNGTYCRELNKVDLANFLSSKNAINMKRYPLYIPEVQGFFYNAYELILTYLHEITCIQIYNDNVIRLHLEYNVFNTSTSILIYDTYNTVSYDLLCNLIAFSEI